MNKIVEFNFGPNQLPQVEDHVRRYIEAYNSRGRKFQLEMPVIRFIPNPVVGTKILMELYPRHLRGEWNSLSMREIVACFNEAAVEEEVNSIRKEFADRGLVVHDKRCLLNAKPFRWVDPKPLATDGHLNGIRPPGTIFCHSRKNVYCGEKNYCAVYIGALFLVCCAPKYIVVDSRGELHNEDGPAIEWVDGFKQYCVDGHHLPAKWQDPSYKDFTNLEFFSGVFGALTSNAKYLKKKVPDRIHLDGVGRLHRLDGPALHLEGEKKLFYINGQPVPEKWILRPEEITIEESILNPNVEMRRAAVQLLGTERIKNMLPLEVVDIDPDPMIGTLWSASLRHPRNGANIEVKMLQVLCGTGRTFWLFVPQEMVTAAQANSWTYGLEGTTIRPEVRT